MTHENISTAQNMEQTGKVGRRHGEAEESETTESAGIDECSIRDRKRFSGSSHGGRQNAHRMEKFIFRINLPSSALRSNQRDDLRFRSLHLNLTAVWTCRTSNLFFHAVIPPLLH